MTDERSQKPNKGETWAQLGARNRREFLEMYRHEGNVKPTCKRVGIKYETYRGWMKRYPEFNRAVKQIQAELNKKKIEIFEQNDEWRPGRPWTAGFAPFRKRYFGFDTPAFQQDVVDAYENTRPGNITLILMPPEHGKTTLFEDYACYRLSISPEYRFTVGSEAMGMAKKILRRIRSRMEDDGSALRLVREWGPFQPQAATSRQPWGETYFNIHKKRSHDERDYNVAAAGMTGQIAGTRSDHLHGDDLQSLKTINRTASFAAMFRQDWLSRPGEEGRTTVNGTRVEDGDIYEVLIEELDDDILRVIKMPAIVKDENGEDRPLWPERYTLDSLDRIRRKVGDDAWSRNYMQNPRAAMGRAFNVETVEPCLNPLLPLLHKRAGLEEERQIYIGLDPGYGRGKNVMMAWSVDSDRMRLIDVSEETGLENNEQIMQLLENMVREITGLGGNVTDVIIEAKNFQQGLAKDDRLLEIRNVYGFALREHLTGVNKYDENIGVRSMVTSFLRKEVEIPWGDDDRTRAMVEQFKEQLYAWKPNVRGAVLRQDFVMAMWFCWILWTERRQGLRASMREGRRSFSYINTGGAPSLVKRGSGLLVPPKGVFG